MTGPRRDTRGIVDPRGLLARVRFRRREPAPALLPYVEHYWLIDWDLAEPYAAQVVPHPSVNLTFQYDGASGPAHGAATGIGEITGIGLELFTRRLEGLGRVCGVTFRPGGFRPFAPGRPVSGWTGRVVPLATAWPALPAGVIASVLRPDAEEDRIAALDAFLLSRRPAPDPAAREAMDLVGLIRRDPTLCRVADVAAAGGMSVRSLQRLFSGYVGVSPKWVLLRYRIHEALERAAGDEDVGWAALAQELGYSDQSHLARDFTATVGVPPSAYAR